MVAARRGVEEKGRAAGAIARGAVSMATAGLVRASAMRGFALAIACCDDEREVKLLFGASKCVAAAQSQVSLR